MMEKNGMMGKTSDEVSAALSALGCPFSADRLREMRWREGWQLAQIVTLANALCEAAVDAARVVEWFQAAGVPLEPARASPSQIPRPLRAAGKVSRSCEQCGAEVVRYRSEFEAHTFCSEVCSVDWRRAQAAERRDLRKAASREPLLAAALGLCGERKRCLVCGVEKPITDFAMDVSRKDAHANNCKGCNRAKNVAWYAANREAHRARVQRRRLGGS